MQLVNAKVYLAHIMKGDIMSDDSVRLCLYKGWFFLVFAFICFGGGIILSTLTFVNILSIGFWLLVGFLELLFLCFTYFAVDEFKTAGYYSGKIDEFNKKETQEQKEDPKEPQ